MKLHHHVSFHVLLFCLDTYIPYTFFHIPLYSSPLLALPLTMTPANISNRMMNTTDNNNFAFTPIPDVDSHIAQPPACPLTQELLFAINTAQHPSTPFLDALCIACEQPSCNHERAPVTFAAPQVTWIANKLQFPASWCLTRKGVLNLTHHRPPLRPCHMNIVCLICSNTLGSHTGTGLKRAGDDNSAHPNIAKRTRLIQPTPIPTLSSTSSSPLATIHIYQPNHALTPSSASSTIENTYDSSRNLSIPLFIPNGDLTPEAYILNFVEDMNVNGAVPETTLKRKLIFGLPDSARQWGRDNITKGVNKQGLPLSWAEACAAFILHFASSDQPTRNLHNFKSLKQQQDESIVEFADRFTTASELAQANPASPLIIDHFVTSLLLPLQHHMRAAHYLSGPASTHKQSAAMYDNVAVAIQAARRAETFVNAAAFSEKHTKPPSSITADDEQNDNESPRSNTLDDEQDDE